VSIEWEFNLYLDGLKAEMEARIPGALAKGLEHVRTVATPLVPVETGALAGSGGITVTGHEGQILYPGPYALYQHEGVYYRHGRFGAPLRHTHGESFFLLRPMIQEADTVLEIVRREVGL
jgi:hypothetical protein